MFQLIAEVIYAGVALTFAIMPVETYFLPKAGQVVPVVFNEVKPIWVDPCKFSGLIVPFERDWEERTTSFDGQEEIVPAEPGKIGGYAMIFNKKECPGEAAQPVSMAITKMGEDRLIFAKRHYIANSLDSATEEMKPKWLPQVTKVLEAKAESDPAVASFIAFSKQNAKTSAAETPATESKAQALGQPAEVPSTEALETPKAEADPALGKV